MMYRFGQILVMLLIGTSILFAQNEILNPGFENWTNALPDNWTTTNVTGTVTNVTQSSTAHSGSSALKGEIVQFSGVPFGPSVRASLGSGIPYINITQAYTQLTGFYKLNAVAPGTLVSVLSTLSDAGFMPVATANDTFSTRNADWKQFVLTYDYSGTNAPVYATIQIALGSDGGGYQIGDYYLLDDIALINPVGVEPVDNNLQPENFQLQQNYPNPFNPSTTFEFSLINSAYTTLLIYDLLGRKMASVVDEPLTAGSYRINWDASALSSGTYFYVLTAGEQRQTRKMMILQ